MTHPPTRPLPLDGIRVLDFGTALAGPFAPMIMSDLGADVIKIDPIDKAGTAADATYAACHRGKRSIAINLKTAEGQQIAAELIRSADVLHYNLRTGNTPSAVQLIKRRRILGMTAHHPPLLSLTK